MGGQRAAHLRRRDAGRRIAGEAPRARAEAEEAAHGGQLAGDRGALGRRRRACAASGGSRRAPTPASRSPPAVVEELAHVGQIGAQRVRRGVPFDTQVRGEGVDGVRRGRAVLVGIRARDGINRVRTEQGDDDARGEPRPLPRRRRDAPLRRGLSSRSVHARAAPRKRFLDAHYVHIDLPARAPVHQRASRATRSSRRWSW